jgi:molybdopterin/thiamine biosynthesis adenylyltransferase
MMNERYARQVILPDLGESGQQKLLHSSVLVVGCGGLGSVLLYCLCGMGVGRIGFCDGDVVSRSNLNRQFLHTPRDVGRQKTRSACEKLKAFAPELTFEPFGFNLTRENAQKTISGYDVVLLAVDSLPARLIANEACVRQKIPLVDGGISGMNGTLLTVRPGETACLCCLYADAATPDGPPASFAPIVSMISAMQAQSCANILLGLKNPSDGVILLLDGASLRIDRTHIQKSESCPVCSAKKDLRFR